jgi:hypothetical protein
MARCAWLLLALVALSWPSRGRAEGFLVGPEHRWPHRNVLERVALDVVAIPAGVTRWEVADWAQLAGWSAAVGTLMFVGRPGLDVQLDRWMTQHLDGRVPDIWGIPMQVVLWGGIAAAGLGTWWWSLHTGNAWLAQGCSLMAEALAVSQVYHLSLKFLIGREGPRDGSGLGRILGPRNAFDVYPAGTPSGHAATLFSLMSVGMTYFELPGWVRVGTFAAVSGLLAFRVINHRHFLSDTLWGAAMGWYVGQWVVRHRAADAQARATSGRLTVLPLALGRGGGLALAGTF